MNDNAMLGAGSEEPENKRPSTHSMACSTEEQGLLQIQDNVDHEKSEALEPVVEAEQCQDISLNLTAAQHVCGPEHVIGQSLQFSGAPERNTSEGIAQNGRRIDEPADRAEGILSLQQDQEPQEFPSRLHLEEGVNRFLATSDDETTMAEAKIQTCTQGVSKPLVPIRDEETDNQQPKGVGPQLTSPRNDQPTFRKPHTPKLPKKDLQNKKASRFGHHKQEIAHRRYGVEIKRHAGPNQVKGTLQEDKENIDPRQQPIAKESPQRKPKAKQHLANNNLQTARKKGREKLAGAKGKKKAVKAGQQPARKQRQPRQKAARDAAEWRDNDNDSRPADADLPVNITRGKGNKDPSWLIDPVQEEKVTFGLCMHTNSKLNMTALGR